MECDRSSWELLQNTSEFNTTSYLLFVENNATNQVDFCKQDLRFWLFVLNSDMLNLMLRPDLALISNLSQNHIPPKQRTNRVFKNDIKQCWCPVQ